MVQVDASAGHGWRDNGSFDPGAIGTDGRYENHEAHEALIEFAEALERNGVSYHVESRGTDNREDPNYVGSIRRVNNTDPAVALEFHLDWSGGPQGLIALHAGSTQGERLARSIADAVKEFGLPVVREGHSKDTDYGRRIQLAFVQRTEPPACLIELNRIADYPREVNELQGEAIAKGVVEYLGKTWVSKDDAAVDYAVVCAWDDTNDNAEGRGFDQALATFLGKRWTFKVLPRTQLDDYRIKRVVGVGFNADLLADLGTDDGVVVAGQTRYETLDRVYSLAYGEPPHRRDPWPHLGG